MVRKKEIRRQLCGRGDKVEVYDAGSGFGQYSYFIARNFPDATLLGIDLKNDQIEDCRIFFQIGRTYKLFF